MKERPILFNASMVRAILKGRKTQTRRVIKPQPVLGKPWKHGWIVDPDVMDIPIAYCPHGIPEDRLWVRETWATIATYDYLKPSVIPNGEARRPVIYYAAHPESAAWNSPNRGKVRPSIFMPRWASRIMLEVTGVRVEQVQEISEKDARAEGLESYSSSYGSGSASFPIQIYKAFPEKDGGFLRATRAFEALWDSINAKRGFGWDANPWVWVIEFEAVRSNPAKR